MLDKSHELNIIEGTKFARATLPIMNLFFFADDNIIFSKGRVENSRKKDVKQVFPSLFDVSDRITQGERDRDERGRKDEVASLISFCLADLLF